MSRLREPLAVLVGMVLVVVALIIVGLLVFAQSGINAGGH